MARGYHTGFDYRLVKDLEVFRACACWAAGLFRAGIVMPRRTLQDAWCVALRWEQDYFTALGDPAEGRRA
jgi:hypothetical protein